MSTKSAFPAAPSFGSDTKPSPEISTKSAFPALSFGSSGGDTKPATVDPAKTPTEASSDNKKIKSTSPAPTSSVFSGLTKPEGEVPAFSFGALNLGTESKDTSSKLPLLQSKVTPPTIATTTTGFAGFGEGFGAKMPTFGTGPLFNVPSKDSPPSFAIAAPKPVATIQPAPPSFAIAPTKPAAATQPSQLPSFAPLKPVAPAAAMIPPAQATAQPVKPPEPTQAKMPSFNLSVPGPTFGADKDLTKQAAPVVPAITKKVNPFAEAPLTAPPVAAVVKAPEAKARPVEKLEDLNFGGGTLNEAINQVCRSIQTELANLKEECILLGEDIADSSELISTTPVSRVEDCNSVYSVQQFTSRYSQEVDDIFAKLSDVLHVRDEMNESLKMVEQRRAQSQSILDNFRNAKEEMNDSFSELGQVQTEQRETLRSKLKMLEKSTESVESTIAEWKK
ncbi:hypothetical protein HDU76_010184, partial [Blyttiomyces sp. JEL0837]